MSGRISLLDKAKASMRPAGPKGFTGQMTAEELELIEGFVEGRIGATHVGKAIVDDPDLSVTAYVMAGVRWLTPRLVHLLKQERGK